MTGAARGQRHQCLDGIRTVIPVVNSSKIANDPIITG